MFHGITWNGLKRTKKLLYHFKKAWYQQIVFSGHKTITQNTDFYSVLGKHRYFAGLQLLVLFLKACQFSLELPTSVILGKLENIN